MSDRIQLHRYEAGGNGNGNGKGTGEEEDPKKSHGYEPHFSNAVKFMFLKSGLLVTRRLRCLLLLYCRCRERLSRRAEDKHVNISAVTRRELRSGAPPEREPLLYGLRGGVGSPVWEDVGEMAVENEKAEGKGWRLCRIPFWGGGGGSGGGSSSTNSSASLTQHSRRSSSRSQVGMARQPEAAGPDASRRHSSGVTVKAVARSLLPTRRHLRLDPPTKLYFPCMYFGFYLNFLFSNCIFVRFFSLVCSYGSWNLFTWMLSILFITLVAGSLVLVSELVLRFKPS